MRKLFTLLTALLLATLLHAAETDVIALLAGGRVDTPAVWDIYDNTDANVVLTAATVPFRGGILTNKSATSSQEWEIPAATVGRIFVAYNYSSTYTLTLDPVVTDIIVGVSGLTLHDGDKVILAAARGTSITLVCLVAGTWDCFGEKGTITDGGAG